MSVIPYGINTAWMLSCRRELRRFQRATRDVAKTQRDLLQEIVASNLGAVFGHEHGFHSIRDYRDFARGVPISNYDSVRPYVDRICRGESNVLTTDPVLLLEPTGGSTSGRKLIPYTKRLRASMQRAVSAWVADLFEQRPSVRRGKAYWSISPAMGTSERTAGGLRIGFADDTEYLSGFARWAVRGVLAVATEVAKLDSIQQFRRQTLLGLLAAKDLALISVWSPTFLTLLVDELSSSADQLVSDLRKINRQRAGDVDSILSSSRPLHAKLAELWPALALISCWADGTAADYVDRLARLFPAVELQPKGLLATEAFISFPLVDRAGGALAIRSHFFEFAKADQGESDILLAHQLVLGGQYVPIVTTAGGLYRYRMDDVVELVGFAGECPLIRFVGRSNQSSDLVGEKLDEAFVQKAIDFACGSHREKLSFTLLVPCPKLPGYRLYLQTEPGSSLDAVAVSAMFNVFLKRNPHYRYACELEQLVAAEVVIAKEGTQSLGDIYERACLDCGIKSGDIKPTALCVNRQVAWRFQELASSLPSENSQSICNR